VLDGGFHLLVGRDIHELEAIRSRIGWTLAWGFVITMGLGLGGAVLMSRSRVRRIGTINEAIEEIMNGDLSRRIPGDNTGDDIDQLIDRFNRMLAEIEDLVAGIRRVSDNIAHDLRTPLTQLRNRLESLAREVYQAGRQREAVEQAIEASDRLLSTFNALLRIARVESSRPGSEFGTVDLASVVRDVAELYRPLAEEKEQRLEINIMDPVRTAGDRDLLFQALANVFDNAVKYGPEGSRILVTLRSHGVGAEILVADEGSGIPAEARPLVFQRFFRLEEDRSRPGNGLGLSLVAAVARLHQAEVRLEDNHPGLRFVMNLPLSKSGTGA
jgi:signal transduction histidine kinase